MGWSGPRHDRLLPGLQGCTTLRWQSFCNL